MTSWNSCAECSDVTVGGAAVLSGGAAVLSAAAADIQRMLLAYCRLEAEARLVECRATLQLLLLGSALLEQCRPSSLWGS